MSNTTEVNMNKKNIFNLLYEIFWESRYYTTYPMLVLIVMPLLVFFGSIYFVYNIPNIIHYISQLLVIIVENSEILSLCKNNIVHYLTSNFSLLDIKMMVLGCYFTAPVIFGYFIIKIAKRHENKAKHSMLAIVLLLISSVVIVNTPAMLKLDTPLFTQQ